MKGVLVLILLILVVFAVGCTQKEVDVMELKVSSVFKEGDVIPVKYTCEGADVSPPLKLEGLSKDAVSIAIIVDDPDAPIGTFVHWVAWNIPPMEEIPEGIPKLRELSSPIEVVQGRNDFGRIGYNGPCPPRGHGIHHYHFKVYVLDTKLDLSSGATKSELEKAMEGHVIQKGELIGLYERK
ncbi:YbhB/YbcL family Raf kinase inhibitor-like protein [Palaeococcus pacificus]|nr:YbhB/YbcL family Raf kinase inhibitor-like protein [Palaeococcus pacificus]